VLAACRSTAQPRCWCYTPTCPPQKMPHLFETLNPFGRRRRGQVQSSEAAARNEVLAEWLRRRGRRPARRAQRTWHQLPTASVPLPAATRWL
jgi:hypothetical protein